MDLISREKVKNTILDFGGFNTWEDKSELMYEISFVPSAFEGMTIGEVLETVFSNVVIDRVSDECPVATIRIGTEVFSCYKKWLDSPYKGVSE